MSSRRSTSLLAQLADLDRRIDMSLLARNESAESAQVAKKRHDAADTEFNQLWDSCHSLCQAHTTALNNMRRYDLLLSQNPDVSTRKHNAWVAKANHYEDHSKILDAAWAQVCADLEIARTTEQQLLKLAKEERKRYDSDKQAYLRLCAEKANVAASFKAMMQSEQQARDAGARFEERGPRSTSRGRDRSWDRGLRPGYGSPSRGPPAQPQTSKTRRSESSRPLYDHSLPTSSQRKYYPSNDSVYPSDFSSSRQANYVIVEPAAKPSRGSYQYVRRERVFVRR